MLRSLVELNRKALTYRIVSGPAHLEPSFIVGLVARSLYFQIQESRGVVTLSGRTVALLDKHG